MEEDKEKKAIERIEDTIYTHNGYGINHFKKITLYESGIDDIQTILNLIQKQQTEIDEKDKIIDKIIAEIWNNYKQIFKLDYGIESKEELKKYFEIKAEQN